MVSGTGLPAQLPSSRCWWGWALFQDSPGWPGKLSRGQLAVAKPVKDSWVALETKSVCDLRREVASAKRGGFLLLRSRYSKEGCRTGTDAGPRVTGLESSAAGLEGRVHEGTSCTCCHFTCAFSIALQCLQISWARRCIYTYV